MLYFCHAELISGIMFNISTEEIEGLNQAFELRLASN